MPECVDSILKQTYSNLDVILIDDGSPDLCGQLADRYAEEDSRVRVIHQKNAGLSAARNAGTRQAHGEWITFVDGDDVLRPDCIEYLYKLVVETRAQVGICPMRSSRECERASKETTCVYDRTQALEEMLYQRAFDTSACAKLFRTEDAIEVPFPVGKLFEDLFTVYQLIWRAERIAYGSEVKYIYRVRSGSIMHTGFTPKRFDEIEAADEIVKFVECQCPDLLRAAKCRRFSAYCQAFLATPTDQGMYERECADIWKVIRQSSLEILVDSKARVKNRVAAMLALLGKFIFRWVWQNTILH